MTTESFEELRRHLLQQESVQRMIQLRAYEIYQLRGCQPGGEAQDWFHAEGEVLAFLIASESSQTNQTLSTAEPAPEMSNLNPAQSSAAKPQTAKKPRAKRAADGKQTSRSAAAPKSTTARKSTKSKPKPERTRKSKPENAD